MSYNIRWHEPCTFYLFELQNGLKKFGVTNNLKVRTQQNAIRYKTLIEEYEFTDELEFGWEAYLYEQVVKYRCERFLLRQKQELVWYDVPAEVIIAAYMDTKEELLYITECYKDIHKIKSTSYRQRQYKEIALRLGIYSGKIDRNTQQFYV